MPIVVAFVSQKGGVGKSTLARALAAVSAHGRLKVKLADLDVQQHTALRWDKARKEGRSLPPLDVEAFGTVEEALAKSAGSDLLIIDAPGHASRATVDIARRAHLVVMPTGASFDDLHPTVLLLHELVQAGIPRDRLVVALCRVLERGEEEAAREYVGVAGYEVLPGSIPERAAYRDAQNRGQALTETGQRSLNERADALMEALLKKVLMQVKSAKTTSKRKEKGGAA